MRTLEGQADWSEWRVAVCDLKGRRVLLQPFLLAGEKRPAGAIPRSERFTPRRATTPVSTAVSP